MLGRFIFSLAIFFLGESWLAHAQTTPNACNLPESVQSDLTLDPKCSYQGQLNISASNLTVDCRGATIDASSKRNGILIRGNSIQNVVVRNCTIQNARLQGVLLQQPTDDADMVSRSLAERFQIAINGVRLEKIKVIKSGAVGIYIDSYSQNVVVENVEVTGSFGAGFYLEHSSRGNTIRDSLIQGNGFGDPTGVRKSAVREAIAIDSSAFNTIENNRFEKNAAGGIFLYKNCWEHHSRPGTVQRWQHSSHNMISGNSFDNEKVGIWVASRQTRNLSTWDCGDDAVAPGYFRDYAENNTIENNRFTNTDVGVRVNDDMTKVVGNIFEKADDGCVELGSPTRDKILGQPVSGTELKNNICDLTSAGISKLPDGNGFRVFGRSRFASCAGNQLDGTQASCAR